MTWNAFEQRCIDVALLPLKAVIALVVVVFFPPPKVIVEEDGDTIGYYVIGGEDETMAESPTQDNRQRIGRAAPKLRPRRQRGQFTLQ